MADKKEIKPVKMIGKDPELGHLSKEAAQAKWRKQRELDAKMKAYEVKAKAEIEAEELAKQEAPKEVKDSSLGYVDTFEEAKETSKKTKPKK